MKTRSLIHGVVGGLAGGAIFGMMMGMMGMLPMIGKMAGVPTAAAGFVIHMGISSMIGASFVVLYRKRLGSARQDLTSGLSYGAAWWLLGPMTLMPLMMGAGLGVAWNLAAVQKAMPSLMGHLIFGAVLGLVAWRLETRAATRAEDGIPDTLGAVIADPGRS